MSNTYTLTSFGSSYSVDANISGVSVSHNDLSVSSPYTSHISTFFKEISSTSGILSDTGIMPPGVLYLNRNLIIFERPPQYVNIQLIPNIVDDISYDNSSCHTYRIPIPWQLYFVTYDSEKSSSYYPASLRMFFMNSSLANSYSSQHSLYLPPLPNFYSDGTLCPPFYSSYDDISRYSQDVSGLIQAAYDWVWNSGTNLDLTSAVVDFCYQIRYGNYLNKDNTIVSSSLDFYNITSYLSEPSYFYATQQTVMEILDSWQRVSIQDITFVDWPIPHIYKMFPYSYANTNPSYADHFDYYINNVCEILEDLSLDEVDVSSLSYPSALDISEIRQDFYSYLRSKLYSNNSNKSFDDILKLVYDKDVAELHYFNFSSTHLNKTDHLGNAISRLISFVST